MFYAIAIGLVVAFGVLLEWIEFKLWKKRFLKMELDIKRLKEDYSLKDELKKIVS